MTMGIHAYFGSIIGASQTLLDLIKIRPLLSGLSATAANVTPSVPAFGFGKPSPNTACGTQRSSKSGAPGPEEWSFTGAPALPFA